MEGKEGAAAPFTSSVSAKYSTGQFTRYIACHFFINLILQFKFLYRYYLHQFVFLIQNFLKTRFFIENYGI